MPKGALTRVKERLRGWRRRLRGVPPKPDWVQVEINNTCNLDCIMCPREAMTRPNRHMTQQEFQEIADKVKRAEVRRIRLFLLGEPLLHRELIPMIRYCKQIGIPSVEINTNAVLLDEAASEQLINAGLGELVISMDGANAETYEAVRRGAVYEEVVANVRNFFQIRAELGKQRPRGVIQTMLMEPTRQQIAQFVELWQPVADELRIQSVREYGGLEGLSYTKRTADDELRPCPALWSYLVILSDLTVVPCCTDINGELALGKITEADITDFWLHNERLNSLRRRHCALTFDGLPLCQDCEMISLDLMKRKAAAASAYARP